MDAAHIWHEDTGPGTGEPLLLLHPGGTDSRSMQVLRDQLPGYRHLLVDRPGHGRTPDVDGSWSFAGMADAVAAVLRELPVERAHVVGWSDGSIVGLELARRHPDLVRTLVFGAAVFHHDGWLPGVLGGEPPEFMADSYAEVSPDGRAHWGEVVRKSDALHAVEPALTTADLAAIVQPVLVLSGDDDEVRLDHLAELYASLPDGELAIVPRATHAAIVEKPELIARLIRDFHAEPRSNGYAPMRRS